MSDSEWRAERFADRFRAVYLTFHRRDGPRGQLQGASRAVLEHLAMAGPLTIGEAATHLNRSQSVVSEIVSHLEDQGLLERDVAAPASHARPVHCTDESGQLQPFEQRFERMVAWQARRDPGASREQLERQTLDYLATMPAWRDHPAVKR